MATTEYFMDKDSTGNTSTFDPTNDYYSTDYDDELCDGPSVTKFGSNVTLVFYSIVVILSLSGNILIIVILAKFENLKSLTNAFILNLAVSDLFFTIGLPFWAYYHIYGWTLGEPACKIVSFVFYVGFYSSGIILILMTAQRYVAVIYPLSDIMSTTSFYGVLASVIIWAASVLISSPAFMFTKVIDQNYCGYAESYWSLWGIYQQNALFVVSSMVFIFCYSQIICRLLRPNAQRRKNKTLKLIFILLVVFFVGWAPYNVVIFLQSMYFWPQKEVDSKVLVARCEGQKPLKFAFYISRIFAVSHCCLNPVFYVFVGVKFKNHLKKILQSWGHSNNSSSSSIRSRQSRLTITSVTSGEEFSI